MWTSWETRCGIASYTGALVEALRQRGVAVDVVPVPYTDRDPGTMAETLARLNRADVIHVQHEYTFFGGVAPATSSLPRYYRLLKRPRVVTAHTVFTAGELLRLPTEHRWRQRLAKRALAAYPPYRDYVERAPFRGAAAVVVHTEAARREMLKRRLPAERVEVIPAGTPPTLPGGASLQEVEAFRGRFDLRGSRVVTIFGYVTPEKGYSSALEALSALPPGLKLLIAGGTRVEHERAYMDSLQEDIRARGLSGRVAITGYLEEPELAAAMAVSDLVLVPHTVANGSYSVMIALGYGKAVLASDLACFREIHEQGGGVELFEAGDERSLAERLGFLLASASARKALAGMAAEYAASRSWASVADRTRAVYEQVLRTT